MDYVLKNEDLGYDEFFESKRKGFGLDGFDVARVASENRGSYEVVNRNGRFLAQITGKQMFDALSREDYPAVGDWVLITKLDYDQAVINAILPRKTLIQRKHGDKDKVGNKTDVQIIGTNIDFAFIVESVGKDYNLNRFERYFNIIEDKNIEPIIVLNKIDLISNEKASLLKSEIEKRFSNVKVIFTSTVSDSGLDELRAYIQKGKTYCFLGSSGVGKSSLINKLIGDEFIKVGSISEHNKEGKHTTTSREMYFLKNGGVVIDNPGLREVGAVDGSKIDNVFDEIAELGQKCKFSDCSHISEYGCEVLKALKEGRLDRGKYGNYLRLKSEVEYYEMSDLEKREKDRDFGKFIKKAKEDLKKYK